MYGDIVLLIEVYNTKEKFFDLISETFPRKSREMSRIRKAYVLVRRTFILAARSPNHRHRVIRENGQHAMSHPLAVAVLVYHELKKRGVVDHEAIIAALLHDMVEDFPWLWSIARICRLFGERVARMVKVLTKPPLSEFGGEKKARDAAYFHRLWFAESTVIIIKICDRFHAHCTFEGLEPAKIVRKWLETHREYLELARKGEVLVEELEWIMSHVPMGTHSHEPVF